MVSHRDTSKINLVSKTKFQYPVDIGIPQISDPALSGATCPRFFMQKYAVYWPEGGAASQYSVFIGQKMSLTG